MTDEVTENINNLFKLSGLEKKEFAGKVGIKYNTFLDKLKRGKWDENELKRIADFCMVSVGSLFNETLDDLQKGSNTRTVKVFSKIAAGKEIAVWDKPEFEMEISHPELNRFNREITAFIVQGNSMYPRFREGTVLLTTMLNLNSADKPRDEDFIVTVFNVKRGYDTSGANVKLFHWTDKTKGDFSLTSLNTLESIYKPTFHNLSEVRYMFRVYWDFSRVDYHEKITRN